MADADAEQQLELIGPRGGLLPKPIRLGVMPIAQRDPVASVLLDSPVPHLDRPFDYLVPATLDDAAAVGARVRVGFGGRRVEGYILRRRKESADGRPVTGLRRLDAVVSPEVVLPAAMQLLCRHVADHYLGTMADVVRLAVPPRHAAAEDEARRAVPDPLAVTDAVAARAAAALADSLWSPYRGSRELLRRLTAEPAPTGARPAVRVWSCLPGTDWAEKVVSLLVHSDRNGCGAIAVVPDGRDLDRLEERLAAHLDRARFAVMTAAAPPAQRYREYIEVVRGVTRIVIGTRSAVYAPVHQLSLVVVWDDGDDSHSERRAPYPHTREIAAIRSSAEGVDLVVGGYAQTPQAARWLDIGWAVPLAADRSTVRAHQPAIRASSDSYDRATPEQAAARIPPIAARAIRAGLAQGPVLVQVGRRGYLPVVACSQCRQRAECPTCGGSLRVSSGHALPTCSRCGGLAGSWICNACGGTRVRAISVGSTRTAEELGRAFPGARIVAVDADHPRERIADEPAIVVATPGAEPWASSGYTAAVVLDMAAALRLPGLRSGENAARRWFNALALVRSGSAAVLVGDSALPVVQSLIRWDPGAWAERELTRRSEAGMPPARRAATLTGSDEAVTGLIGQLPTGGPTIIIGPSQTDDGDHLALITWPYTESTRVLGEIHGLLLTRSAERRSAVRVRVDPPDLP